MGSRTVLVLGVAALSAGVAGATGCGESEGDGAAIHGQAGDDTTGDDASGDDDATSEGDDDVTPPGDDDTTGSDDDTASGGEEAGPPCGTPAAGSGSVTCVDRTQGDFALGTADGVSLRIKGGLALDSATWHSGTDETGLYNGGTYHYGTWTSDTLEPALPIREVIPSWNAVTPEGTWIQFEVMARFSGVWTGAYNLGVWASGSHAVARTSVEGQADGSGEVWTDTLHLYSAAEALRYRLTLFTESDSPTPVLSRAALSVSNPAAGHPGTPSGAATGILLAVPERSQMAFAEGEAWCSPTSTSMVMAYWADVTGDDALDVPVPDVASGTWDEAYGGNGNWPFNVAYASSHGLAGLVARLDSLGQVEEWVQAGVPVIQSVAYGPGELDGAPISSTDGHLQVVVGFDGSGDPVCNDPASPDDASVQRTYDRDQLETVWLDASGGLVYLIFPAGWPIPGNSWGMW